MQFNKLSDAQKLKLVPFSKWLDWFPSNVSYIRSTQDQIMKDPSRKTMIVRRKDGRIALFVDNLNAKREPATRQVSKSGKYRSIRHLAESLFAENPDLPLIAFKTRMKEEYPDSAPAGDKCYGHWCWYRSKLVIKGQFRCVPVPTWMQARSK